MNLADLKSWVEVPTDSDFPIQNIPFGICKRANRTFLSSRIGNKVVDIAKLKELGMLEDIQISDESLVNNYMNDFIAQGKSVTSEVRNRIIDILRSDQDYKDASAKANEFLFELGEVEVLLPVKINDYTDFYSSKEHATNVGTMFRDPENALLPNWRHIPVGYHGRASSIIVSGTPIRRPKGQQIPNDSKVPVYGPCKLLDLELEMGFIVGKSNPLGSSISTNEAEEYIFGLALFNDWSARDIQKWEYVPLGPFLGKSFASTLSPWIVTLEALEIFKVAGPEPEVPILPYLEYAGKKNYDIKLEVELITEAGSKTTICKSNFQYMYWNMCQQLAHHTVNGCNMQVGDLCASGTISGKDPNSYGSMLELSWKGTKPITLTDGSERKFIKDGDSINLKGYGSKDGIRIGFGDCIGKILPAS